MSAGRLTIDVRSYWHPGAGRGGGPVVDAVSHRDSVGLPVLPGRHIKGLLRDALERAASFQWNGYEGVADILFGMRTEADSGRIPDPGSLRVGDASLPTAVADWLGGAGEGKKLVPYFFRSLYATAVDQASGTAMDKSLRGIEVVVPLTLVAPITPMPGREPPADWPEKLRRVLPLIDAVGAHRTRGLGRAVLTIEAIV